MARQKAVFINIYVFLMTSYNKHLPVIRSIVTMTGCCGGTVTMTGCCSGVDTTMTIPVRYVIDFSNPGIIFHREM
jgi:hypothetical protein